VLSAQVPYRDVFLVVFLVALCRNSKTDGREEASNPEMDRTEDGGGCEEKEQVRTTSVKEMVTGGRRGETEKGGLWPVILSFRGATRRGEVLYRLES
jgi:hypothetical protein